ncbi:1,4-beta-xylanase [Opitutaceae bacterium EW11]|nr:1,4-beta-xylanase [Opitutaceae bacterium EW11]
MNPSRFVPLLGLLAVFAASLPAQNPLTVPLWPDGAPGSEARKSEPEQARDYWVKNIHNPSITVFLPPKEKATGAAVVICPGGGHRELVFNAEGVEAAQFFNSIGVAAFALKYRLAREPGSPYQVEREAPEDARRAIRVIRSRAKEWGVDPRRVGIVGFSAGGEVAAMVSYRPAPAPSGRADEIDRLDARPDFDIYIYPGPLGFPEKISSQAPPAFFLAAVHDDATTVISRMLEVYRAANVPVEVHLYAQGAHAFNMGHRSEFISLRNWSNRVADWMLDEGLLRPSPAK